MNKKISIVATPIGNLDDISFRVIRTLKEADLILAEDTRITKKLLNILEIKFPDIFVYNQHTDNNAQEIINKIKNNYNNICLVSDAGTPIIADPGCELIKLAQKENIKIESIPGPCSPIVALTLSGFDASKFTFNGFLPKSYSKMETTLFQSFNKPETQIFFITKHNVVDVLNIISNIPINRRLCIARELTKLNEEAIITDSNNIDDEFIKTVTLKGEFILLIDSLNVEFSLTEEEIVTKMLELTEKMKPKEAAKILADGSDFSSKEIYKMYLETK